MLPEQPSPLVGRDALLRTVTELLARSDVRLVTLTGFGGVGKTRLATAAARRAAADYDLVRFIDLTPHDRDHVLTAIAGAVGIEPWRADPRFTRLAAELRNSRTLLVLDNFEHVLDAAPIVASLLTAIPNLHLVVTSREPLHLRWEHVVRVPPLAAPDVHDLATLEALAANPAVAMFIACIQRVEPDFQLTEDNAASLAELCQRLDGLPLALELAAGLLQTSSLDQLRERLNGNLDSLRYRLRDLPGRQTSMHDAIEWSYRLLSTRERQVARQAAIFAGGGTLGAARAVIDGQPDDAPLEDTLAALAEKSLISFDTGHEGAPRFQLLGLAREFLLDVAVEERPALERRFAAYYLKLVRDLTGGAGNVPESAAIGRLHRERGNFRAILQSAAEGHDPETGLQLAILLTDYWYRSGQLAEATRWFEQLLPWFDTPEQIESRIAALRRAGRFALYRGDLRSAGTHLELALEALASIDAVDEHVETLIDLGRVRLKQGDVSATTRVLNRLAALPDADVKRRLVCEEYLRGAVLASTGALNDARAHLVEARRLADAHGTEEMSTWIILRLADTEFLSGALDEARAGYAEVVSRASQAIDWALEARGRIGLGIIANREGESSAALEYLSDAFEIADQHDAKISVVTAIDALSMLGLSKSVIRTEWIPLAGMAAAMYERLGIEPTTLERLRTADHRRLVTHVLGEAETARLESSGRSLTLEHVRVMLEEARQDMPEPSRAPSPTSDNGESVRLTRRERQVVRLIAHGLTNRQIASQLDIAERTVDSHVTNVFKKLEVSSRVNVAAWAIERGMANH